MALPVVKVASGGLPVTIAGAGYGVPCEIASNGYGIPITLVTGGAGGGLAIVDPKGGIGGGGAGPEAAAFLARTSGLDTTHTNAYTTLINGLVADGVWSKLDMLHVYATQNSTTALLNLKSSSYAAVLQGAPAFTTDRGFTGVNASTTVYIDTQFNPTVGTPQFSTNSAHFSVWNLVDYQAASPEGCIMGNTSSGGSNRSHIFPRYLGPTFYFSALAGDATAGNSNSTGHYISNRSGGSATQGYKNGSSVGTGSGGAFAPLSQNFYVLADNLSGTAANATAYQAAAVSIGSSLSSTDATNFYNRLRAYMTVVGVP